MKITRRNILKALGIGAAVSVSGASIANTPKSINGEHSSWEHVEEAVKIMNAAQPVPLSGGGPFSQYMFRNQEDI